MQVISLYALSSVDQFKMNDWKSLSTNANGKIHTANGRFYHVKWNTSGTISVERDISTSNFWTRVAEVWERGVFTVSAAKRLEEKLNSYAVREKTEVPLRAQIDTSLLNIEELNEALNSMQEPLQAITFHPHIHPERTELKQRYIAETGQAISTYQTAVNKKIDVMKNEIAGLKRQLTEWKESNELPSGFEQQHRHSAHTIKKLQLKVAEFMELKQKHHFALQSFIFALNLTKHLSMQTALLSRIGSLTTPLCDALALTPNDKNQKRIHDAFLIQQKKVAAALTQALSGSDTQKSTIQVCGELLDEPVCSDEAVNTRIDMFYKQKLQKLSDVIDDPLACWETINKEIAEFARYKADLTSQFTTLKEIDQFLTERCVNNDRALLNGRLYALHRIEIDITHSPGVFLNRAEICATAENHMQTIQLGEEVTDFLDKEIAGNRGVHTFHGNYYDPDMQRVINSLRDIEEVCKKGSEEINIDALKIKVEQHKHALHEWSQTHNVSMQAYADYESIARDETVETHEVKLRQQKIAAANARWEEGVAEIKENLGQLMVQQHQNKFLLKEREKALERVHKKMELFTEHSAQLKQKAQSLHDSYTLKGKLSKLFS